VQERDLDYRPRSYFVTDPESAIMSRIKGAARRATVRKMGLANVDELTRAESLSATERAAVSRLHPGLMGGEYLPDLEFGEVEIARLELKSTTGDVLSFRARWLGTSIQYRLVDEYQSDFLLAFCRSDLPLTLGEMIQVLGEFPEYYRDFNLEHADDPKELVDFVRVSSEFYPELAAYFKEEAEAWYQATIGDQDADDEEDSQPEFKLLRPGVTMTFGGPMLTFYRRDPTPLPPDIQDDEER
jgi:hypothetical protein